MKTKHNSWLSIKVFLVIKALLVLLPGISNAQSWIPAGAEGFSDGESFSQYIAFLGETPYVAYMDRANGDKATVMKFDGTDWVFVGGAGITENIADEVSLAIDDGVLWLAFQDAAHNSKITVIKNGVPHMAFSDDGNGDKAILMKYTETGWEQVGEAASKSQADYVSLAFSENSIPHLAFRDYWRLRRTTVMKFASVTNSEIIAYDKDLQVWPNPGNGRFNLKLPEAGGKQFHVKIFDSLDKIIYAKSLESGKTTRLDLSGNKNGMYWIKAINGEIN